MIYHILEKPTKNFRFKPPAIAIRRYKAREKRKRQKAWLEEMKQTYSQARQSQDEEIQWRRNTFDNTMGHNDFETLYKNQYINYYPDA